MKAKRQALIRQIVEEQNIQTQEELAEALRKHGMVVTQATVSRDIREMHLIKVLSEDGSYRYAIMDRNDQKVGDRLQRMLEDSMIETARANNLIVVHTIAGSAHVAAEAVDNMHWPEVLGTIAGDNTILVITHDNEEAETVIHRFRSLNK